MDNNDQAVKLQLLLEKFSQLRSSNALVVLTRHVERPL